MEERLTSKQRLYVEGILRGLDSCAAALAAGYSKSYAKVSAHRLGKIQHVAKAIAEIRTEGRKMAAYDLVTAMLEAEAVCAFAKQHKNAMAYCKAVELRAKLSGLLVDKVEVVTVDLAKALSLAEQRVFTAIDVTANGLADWRTQIPGGSDQ